jgi:hypothetical protein
MDLLNVSFAILIIKIALGAVPMVAGVAYFCMQEDSKRELRNSICSGMLGVSNAIPFEKFHRFMVGLSFFAIVIGAIVFWLLVIRPLL